MSDQKTPEPVALIDPSLIVVKCHACSKEYSQHPRSVIQFCSLECTNDYHRFYAVMMQYALTVYRKAFPTAKHSEVDERTAALDHYRSEGFDLYSAARLEAARLCGDATRGGSEGGPLLQWVRWTTESAAAAPADGPGAAAAAAATAASNGDSAPS